MGINVKTVSGNQLNSSRRVTPGFYHAVITDMKESDKCDKLLITGDILAGKPADASAEFVGCHFNLQFFYPDPSKSQELQDKNSARITALLIATDLISPSQLGQDVDVDPTQGIGRHVLVHVRYKQKKVEENGKEVWVDDTQYLDLAFNDILHIDDPAGANIPKNVAAMKFIPAVCRHTDAKYFAFKASAASSLTGAPAPVSATTQPAAASAVAGGF